MEYVASGCPCGAVEAVGGEPVPGYPGMTATGAADRAKITETPYWLWLLLIRRQNDVHEAQYGARHDAQFQAYYAEYATGG